MTASSEQCIQRYLRTGEHEDALHALAGENTFASAPLGHAALLNALIAAVRTRTAYASVPKALVDLDVVAFTRAKVEPMVLGLFTAHEQAAVLEVLERAVVFLTPANIGAVLGGMRWLTTAWDVANLDLASIDAPLLSDSAPQILGLSEETACYVCANHFHEERRFDDFVVHEVAHIFHNCKRETIGLPETRSREWLLEIDFAKRETFAYACEAYSRLVTLGSGRAAQALLLAELAKAPTVADDRVDIDEYLDILREAIAARNGWKRILKRCAPAKPGRARINLSTIKQAADDASSD
jgi:hypothetical protein